jgi:hypothetical protein
VTPDLMVVYDDSNLNGYQSGNLRDLLDMILVRCKEIKIEVVIIESRIVETSEEE